MNTKFLAEQAIFKDRAFLSCHTDTSAYIRLVLDGSRVTLLIIISYLPTPPLGQDMTQGQFF